MSNWATDTTPSGRVSRRDFLKVCTAAAVYMGLPASMGVQLAAAATRTQRPPVIWLSGQGCTGCTESLLRPGHPSLEHLILNQIALDYNETLNTGAGHQAEEYKKKSIQDNLNRFILVVEGAIPTKDGGIYCQVAGQNFVDIVKETAAKAAAVIAIGSCASWGGIPSAAPNPTGAKGVPEVLAGTTVGGLYVAFTVAAALYHKGARLAVIFSYVGAAAIVRIPMTIFEASFMGLKFSLIRLLISLPLVVMSAEVLGLYLEKRHFRLTEDSR